MLSVQAHPSSTDHRISAQPAATAALLATFVCLLLILAADSDQAPEAFTHAVTFLDAARVALTLRHSALS